MTATRIRETADGILYRLSEAVEYTAWSQTTGEFIDRESDHVVIHGNDIRARVCAVDDRGVMWYAPIKVSLSITDPDAMIEKMGYTVIREDG